MPNGQHLNNFARFYPLPGKTCYPLVLAGKGKMLPTILPDNHRVMSNNSYTQCPLQVKSGMGKMQLSLQPNLRFVVSGTLACSIL